MSMPHRGTLRASRLSLAVLAALSSVLPSAMARAADADSPPADTQATTLDAVRVEGRRTRPGCAGRHRHPAWG